MKTIFSHFFGGSWGEYLKVFITLEIHDFQDKEKCKIRLKIFIQEMKSTQVPLTRHPLLEVNSS